MARRALGGSRMHIILTADQHKQLRATAKRTGMTVAEHVRRAVDFYLAGVRESELEGLRQSPSKR